VVGAGATGVCSENVATGPSQIRRVSAATGWVGGVLNGVRKGRREGRGGTHLPSFIMVAPPPPLLSIKCTTWKK